MAVVFRLSDNTCSFSPHSPALASATRLHSSVAFLSLCSSFHRISLRSSFLFPPIDSQRTTTSIAAFVCVASAFCATPAGALISEGVVRGDPNEFGETQYEEGHPLRNIADPTSLFELTAVTEDEEAVDEAVDAAATASMASSYLRGSEEVAEEATDSLVSSGALAEGEVRGEVAGSASSVPQKMEYVNGHTTVFSVLIFVGGIVFVAAGVGILVRWRRASSYAAIPDMLPVPDSKAAYRLDTRDDSMFMGGSDGYGTGDQEGGEVLFL